LNLKLKCFLKSFKNKVFFKLSEKQLVVLSKQPIVLLLGVFEKVENCFGWLTCCQTKTQQQLQPCIKHMDLDSSKPFITLDQQSPPI